MTHRKRFGWLLLTVASLALVGGRFTRTMPPPGPQPGPAHDFGAAADHALSTAPEADRAAIGEMAAAMARLLVRDGRLPAPRITSSHVMAEVWVELQRLHTGAESPYGDHYPAFEELLGEIFPEVETKIDVPLRADYAAKFAAIAEGLR